MSFRSEKKVRNRLVVFGMFFLLLFLLAEVRGAYKGSGGLPPCFGCHGADFDEDLTRSMIHQPCLEKKCVVCHCKTSADFAADNSPTPSPGVVSSVSEMSVKDYKLKVIDIHLHNNSSHSFLFSDDKVEEVLMVEFWQGKERQKVERVALAPLAELPLLIDDKQAPQLSEIKVEQVERGLFSSAVITWKTDKPTTSEIRFGLTELKQNYFPDECLVCNHRVTLSSLKTNRKYRFAVVSKDLFGNQTVSDSHTLSTEEIDNAISGPPSERLSEGAECSIVRKQFYNVNGGYLVLFELSQSRSLSIGVEELPAPIENSQESSASSISESETGATSPGEGKERRYHRFLLSEVETTIDNCFTCHRDIHREMSHPIDILPAPGMQVPKDYRLLSNGKLSCMTCHVRHGGDHMFRLVRAQGKEFCEGCHAAY